MSWILNIFAKMFAVAVVGRIISIIISILVAFLIYKAIVDPNFFSRTAKSFDKYMEDKKIESKSDSSYDAAKDKLLELVK